MKHIKPSERHARTNQVVTIVAKHIIKTEAENDRGAYQYLKSQPKTKRIELFIGKGRYMGDNKKVTAFVWLDDDSAVLKAA